MIDVPSLFLAGVFQSSNNRGKAQSAQSITLDTVYIESPHEQVNVSAITHAAFSTYALIKTPSNMDRPLDDVISERQVSRILRPYRPPRSVQN